LPKLLDVIKEKGLTHQQVIKLINNMSETDTDELEVQNIPNQEELEEDIEEEEEETEDEVSTDITEDDQEIETKIYQVSEEQLNELIEKAVQESLKAKRKAPSKGKKIDKPLADKNVVRKNMFEVIV